MSIVIADTNVLVRAVVRDEERHSREAVHVLEEAERIAVATVSLCEFVWVLRRVYRFERSVIATALQTLAETKNVVVDRPAVEAGLKALAAGCDFADGVIAHEGARLGSKTFVSFDRNAVAHLANQGYATTLLGS